MTFARNRIVERKGFTDRTRLRLLESDADELEQHLDAATERFDAKLDAILGRFNALLVTIAGSSVVFALSVLAATGKL